MDIDREAIRTASQRLKIQPSTKISTSRPAEIRFSSSNPFVNPNPAMEALVQGILGTAR
jgi:hypothetical protein